MDSKVDSRTGLQPTGKGLLSLLTCVLLLGAIALDGMGGHLLQPTQSLTLPLMVSAISTAALGYGVIPVLQRLKTGQVIREDGPQSHLKKAGTPTMGGIFFIPVALLTAVLWSGFNLNVIAVSLLTFVYAATGWIDDWQILVRKSNKGISPRMKLALLIGGAILFCVWSAWTQPPDITTVSLSFGLTLPLGLFYWLLSGFALVAESNATNLTDGVDGLAGGTGAIAFLGLSAIVAPTYPGLALFCACLSGSCLGFVVHNRNPAKVFMGDTGSLALGGALAAVGIISSHLWGLLIISGIFLVESLSVIAQVLYYKATKDENGKGKRLLKMAPIHHHLELTGWSETQIVGTFYLINAGLVILGVGLSIL